MKKNLATAIFFLTAGLAGATNSFITNFPQGFYIKTTAGSTLSTPLNQYFHVDSMDNTNLVWVSTDTQYGGFLMQLIPTNAPKTVANFLAYVRDGAYENTVIHRSTSLTEDGLAVLQAGGFTADGSLSSIPAFAPITNEYSLSNSPGTVAMAKVGGSPNSATSQWFVNVSDNSTTLNSNNNGGFTVFAKVLGNAMSNVISPISALKTYDLSFYNAAFTQTPLQGVTNVQQPLYLSNLVTFTRVATLPYFAYSSDSDACPTDIDSSTNLIVTFKHYPTNNPANGIYITVAVTDTNGNSPRYTNYSTNITTNNGHTTTNIFTNVYDGGNTGFYVVPSTLGSQTITFPQIPQQALSNNITNITTNYLTNGSNVSISSITTNIYTSFTIDPFPSSSANVPVLIQILSGPIQVTGTKQTNGILKGTQFTLTGTGTVTLKATTIGTGTDALVNYYYNPATPVINSFVIKAYQQIISPFQSIFPPTYGNTPFQIQIPTSSSGLPVFVKVLSGPASFNQASNIGTITINGAGTVTLAANQPGNTLYAPAPQVSKSFTIAQAPQSIGAFTPIASKAYGVASFAITPPAATSKLGVTVSVRSGPATISGNTMTITGAGTVVLAANQAGNENYNGAPEVTTTFTVGKGSQSIGAFTPIASKAYGVAPFAITPPAATSKLGVTVTVKSGPATISGNTVTITGIGTVVLAANQTGNENYIGAPEVTTTFKVTAMAPTLGSFSISSKVYGSEAFELTPPTSTSAGAWSYSSSSSSVAIVSGSTVAIKGVGTTTVTATQAANGNYTGATKTATFTVIAK